MVLTQGQFSPSVSIRIGGVAILGAPEEVSRPAPAEHLISHHDVLPENRSDVKAPL